jgi:eukaryotic-like serine/threonine-protein kinase
MTVLELPTPDPRTFDEFSRPFAEAVAPQYAIRRMIGRGGMGIVYLARDKRLDRLVAIKTLPPQLAADAQVRERFLRETRTAGAMSHPNIVPIHGADEIAGHVFFVMGYVDGDSLAAHVSAHGLIQSTVVTGYLRDVTAALVHAHGRGTIHRDIKAENILIERSSGRALVTDFGIARLAEAAPLTATGQMLGTVYYISPEQVAGDKVDARSDLYSLGVVGFLALTGRFPFESELASAVLIAHVNKAPPPVRSINPNVPSSLAAIIDRCLAKDPAKRYDCAADLLAALDKVGAAPAAGSHPAVPYEKPRLISDTEAESVWQRAAELQADTGIRPRPIPVAAPRDEASDSARTSGFRVDDVRKAGREAGISTRYMDHALIERGLAKSALSHVQDGKKSLWAGVPLDIVREVEVEGEIHPRHFDRLFTVLREGTGREGTTTASRRELGWRCDWPGHHLEVSVAPDDGRTTVRLAQSVRRMAAGTMASFGMLGGVVAGATSVVSKTMMVMYTPDWLRARIPFELYINRSDAEWIALGIGAAAGIVAIAAGRLTVRLLHRQNEAKLRALTEAVSANVKLAARDETV